MCIKRCILKAQEQIILCKNMNFFDLFIFCTVLDFFYCATSHIKYFFNLDFLINLKTKNIIE